MLRGARGSASLEGPPGAMTIADPLAVPGAGLKGVNVGTATFQDA